MNFYCFHFHNCSYYYYFLIINNIISINFMIQAESYFHSTTEIIRALKIFKFMISFDIYFIFILFDLFAIVFHFGFLTFCLAIGLKVAIFEQFNHRLHFNVAFFSCS